MGSSKNPASPLTAGVKSLPVTDLAGQSQQAKSDFSSCPYVYLVGLLMVDSNNGAGSCGYGPPGSLARGQGAAGGSVSRQESTRAEG
jgi:hypothetical protein